MNERIKLLAGQAEMAANKGDHVDVKIMMVKFAELIVRECADTAFLEANSRKVQRAVLQHFGVEE